MLKIALDIDGTITADPPFFSTLARTVLDSGGEIHIVSTRSREGYDETVAEIRGYGIPWTALYLLPPISIAQQRCPHRELDWFQKHLWLKVDYALQNGITHFVDDDQKVLNLLIRFAPDILAISAGDRHLLVA